MSKLYIVGTPIGNLGDISSRALAVLNDVDFIAAEDTRVTAKLLAHFGIKKPLVSNHQHNARSRAEYLADRVQGGETCALVSDAGMPCISDPGEETVRVFADRGIPLEVIPCGSALTAALAVCGLDTSRFTFEGFLSVNKKQRAAHLDEIKAFKRTLVFYEAPHKLKRTLASFLDSLGDRNAALCRELTKIHEEVLRGRLSQLLALYETNEPRGEYVVIIEGNNDKPPPPTLSDAVDFANELVANGAKRADAAKTAAAEYGFHKSEIYSHINNNNDEDTDNFR
ncbi:MAG: 16S rRNA (cytidine(1402)-2'-O)-methyltransferase [Oscillospiraceae bacterium]|jgi:16S rRNA (cytidine1402-2'-O)-methyltransferase|nr:16S rRNA (cytidine(1402)-2'-O)-methyltransferase [Oscillospiraceae bacterium]